MIKTAELRVGNWACFPGGHYPNYAQATDFEMLEYFSRNGDPIPLTPDILESAGFEKWGDDIEPYYVLEMPNGLYINCNSSEVWLGCEGNCVSIGERLTVYLHQLQNLFWCLCGEELTVNLQQLQNIL